jgi:hypothetical protein
MSKSTILDRVKFGSKARLIPVVADSKKEERATSVFLSTMMVVRQFADAVLSEVNTQVGVRARVRCYTEVVFDTKDNSKVRPDGLVVVTLGQKMWSALVESKVGNAELTKEQVETYLDLAKEVGADAVITISNQFATKPTHNPISVNKSKIRSTGLYHLSWLLILSKASVMSQEKNVDDPEQAFILRELIRYLDHPASGVSPMSAMNSGWKNICASVQEGAALKKGDDDVIATAHSWHQLMRYLSLELSMRTGTMAQVSLKRAHSNDADAYLRDTIDDLVNHQALTGSVQIPNTASDILITADLTRRIVTLCMKVRANQDVVRPTAGINWLTRQLKSVEETDLILKAQWPGRTPATQSPLSRVSNEAELLVPEGQKDVPKEFEIFRVLDLGGKFKGQKVFVELVTAALPKFYEEVGQYLTNWVASPPKPKKSDERAEETKDFPDEIDRGDDPTETSGKPESITLGPKEQF